MFVVRVGGCLADFFIAGWAFIVSHTKGKPLSQTNRRDISCSDRTAPPWRGRYVF